MISKQDQQQLTLARAAAEGDKVARTSVNELIHPVIDYQTNKFCQRFCHENRTIYRCSLTRPVGSVSNEALLCEWGNASYGWMLHDLTSANRLKKYEGLNGASLFDYLYRIGNSLPFYERWKDWRFGRRVHVPTYIQDISPHASGVFYGLRSHQELPFIAQQLALSLDQVERLCRLIINTLTKRNRLYLLDPPVSQSLTDASDEDSCSTASQIDLPSWDEPIEDQQQKEKLKKYWSKLDAVEQFVLEALVIDEQDAQSVLTALKQMDIALKKDVSANQTTVQQLYYFKRKTLSKLAGQLND